MSNDRVIKTVDGECLCVLAIGNANHVMNMDDLLSLRDRIDMLIDQLENASPKQESAQLKTDGDKLRLLADWFDKEQNLGRWPADEYHGREVQQDLRLMAKRLDFADSLVQEWGR